MCSVVIPSLKYIINDFKFAEIAVGQTKTQYVSNSLQTSKLHENIVVPIILFPFLYKLCELVGTFTAPPLIFSIYF